MNSSIKNFCKRGLCTTSSKKEGELDFVQKLFIQSIREYYKKLKENNGKIFDVTPELEKERLWKMEMLRKAYARDLSQEEFEKFPTFSFEEPLLDGINLPDRKPSVISKPKRR